MGINFDETASVPDGRGPRPSTEYQGGADPLPFKRAPRELDGYRIVDEIARGGMGVVFRAVDADQHEVAIKFMLSGKNAGSSERERFQREGRALANVRDPNIVALLGHGEYEGMPYLVMDLVKGESLQDRLDRKGPMHPRRAVEITRKLALALEAAHERDIVHRDIKPDNVLLNEQRDPMLTDFGLATGQTEASKQLTRTGAAVGTPGYWAPEQVRADRGKLGPHTDVWGLGATLYAMLTGEPPFDGNTLYEIMAATIEKAPRSLQRQVKEVDAELERICFRCLQKDPEDRYPDTAALADDLERYARRGRSDRAKPASGKTVKLVDPARKPSRETARLPPPARPRGPKPTSQADPGPPFPVGAMLIGVFVIAFFALAVWRGNQRAEPETAQTPVEAPEDELPDVEETPAVEPTRALPQPEPRDPDTGPPTSPNTDPPRSPRNTGPPPDRFDRTGRVVPPKKRNNPYTHLESTIRVTDLGTNARIERYGRALASNLGLSLRSTELQNHDLRPQDKKLSRVLGQGYMVKLSAGLLVGRMTFAGTNDAMEYFGRGLSPNDGAVVVAEQRGEQVTYVVGAALKNVAFARRALKQAWRTTPSTPPRPKKLIAIAALNVCTNGSFGSRVFVNAGSLIKAARRAIEQGRKWQKKPLKGMTVEFLDDAQTHLWVEMKAVCSEVRVSSRGGSVLVGKDRNGVADTNAYLLKLARQVR